MNKFSEFLNEENDHKHGTYVSVKLDVDSAKKLDSWATKNGINNLIDSSEYHVTVLYSKKGVPNAKDYDLNLPINTQIVSWKIFPTQQNTNALVGIVGSKEIVQHHKNIRKEYGATHDYSDYHPHVTLSYNYGAALLPKNVPDFDLVFTKKEFKALDPTFTPKKKD